MDISKLKSALFSTIPFDMTFVTYKDRHLPILEPKVEFLKMIALAVN